MNKYLELVFEGIAITSVWYAFLCIYTFGFELVGYPKVHAQITWFLFAGITSFYLILRNKYTEKK